MQVHSEIVDFRAYSSFLCVFWTPSLLEESYELNSVYLLFCCFVRL